MGGWEEELLLGLESWKNPAVQLFSTEHHCSPTLLGMQAGWRVGGQRLISIPELLSLPNTHLVCARLGQRDRIHKKRVFCLY